MADPSQKAESASGAEDLEKLAKELRALSLADIWRLFINALAKYKVVLDLMTKKLDQASSEDNAAKRRRMIKEYLLLQRKMNKIHRKTVRSMEEGSMLVMADYIVWTYNFMIFFLVVVATAIILYKSTKSPVVLFGTYRVDNLMVEKVK